VKNREVENERKFGMGQPWIMSIEHTF